MSDHSVHAALRSDAPLVVVEAPAGCGKTTKGADYAQEITRLRGSNRQLILTHTHAACSVFADHTKGAGHHVEIHTTDAVIAHIASAYHVGLGLPLNIPAWTRQRKDGYDELALRVAELLKRYPTVAASLAQRYPVVICDEHQDLSAERHAIVMALHTQGARLRIFGDPMQSIFGETRRCDWDALTRQAQAFEKLDFPHRWSKSAPDLGQWILKARASLKEGRPIDLRSGLPSTVTIAFAENQSQKNMEYQLSAHDRKPIDIFERGQTSLLILTPYNVTAQSLRAFFYRRIPLWEGHTRPSLEKLIDVAATKCGNPSAIAEATVDFMKGVGKGFNRSKFGDRFEKEVGESCKGSCHGKPAVIQKLAKFIVAEPNHRGVAKMLGLLWELTTSDEQFAGIKIDCHREFWEAIRLGDFDSVDEGFAEIGFRRAYSRPRPPARAISTIHKAKGLECESVIVVPCDANNFPNNPERRCLLYVALSRAKRRLMLVVSLKNPSPLLSI